MKGKAPPAPSNDILNGHQPNHHSCYRATKTLVPFPKPTDPGLSLVTLLTYYDAEGKVLMPIGSHQFNHNQEAKEE